MLGPYPLDPNLISQGVPPDDRVTPWNIFGPVDGTPLPPGLPFGPPPALPPPPPIEVPAQQPGTDVTGSPQVEPNALNSNGSAAAPSVAVLHYDRRTGRYVTPDGQLYRQSDLVPSKTPKTWKDMLITAS